MHIAIIPLPAAADSFLGKIFSSKIHFEQENLIVETQNGKKFHFNVEIAKTENQQARGLMHRKVLEPEAGMLFWFGGARQPSFWMRNTLIPLDMIFIRRDGTIDHIHSNARPLDETHITSPAQNIWAVLEINGGQSDSWGIKVGDKILHPLFRNVLAQ